MTFRDAVSVCTSESAADAWEYVAAHFLPMDCAFHEFYGAAFPVPVRPGTPMADLTDWEGGGSYLPGGLDYTLVFDGPGRPRLEALRAIVHRYLEPGTVTVSFLANAREIEHRLRRLGGDGCRPNWASANSCCQFRPHRLRRSRAKRRRGRIAHGRMAGAR